MHALAKMYQVFIYLGKVIEPFFLLGLRLFWGWQFFMGGIGKLGNMPQTIDFMNSLSIPSPTFFAYAVAIIETVGGIFLFFGFLGRLAAAFLAAVMLGALSTAHVQASMNILSDPMMFIAQVPVTFLLTSLAVLCFGPGLFSIDAIFKKALLEDHSKQS